PCASSSKPPRPKARESVATQVPSPGRSRRSVPPGKTVTPRRPGFGPRRGRGILAGMSNPPPPWPPSAPPPPPVQPLGYQTPPPFQAFQPFAGGVRCPRCGDPRSQPVTFTWWGGLIGPKLLSHVKCLGCGYGYNAKTGRPNTTGIAI